MFQTVTLKQKSVDPGGTPVGRLPVENHNSKNWEQQSDGQQKVQYVTSGTASAQPTPPHLPQTTYQSG